MTDNEIFTTFGEPRKQWSSSSGGGGDNVITDARLRLVTSICAGATKVLEAAKKIQAALPGEVPWKDEGDPAALAGTASQLWGQMDGNSYKSQCMEYAKLHEMMLGQIGVDAPWEAILPTRTTDAAPGQVLILNARHTSYNYPAKPFCVEINGISQYLPFVLRLKFPRRGHPGEFIPNRYEGGVLVTADGTSTFLTEGATAQVAGTGNGTDSPEYDALLRLAANYSMSVADFQAYYLAPYGWRDSEDPPPP
jgi:hypothetical protein